MTRTTAVDFERPPIQEVVCGALFPPVEHMQTAHLGLLWGQYAEEFPKTVDKMPLGRPGADLDLRPRVWFVSEDEHRLLQVQRDRFHFNWRRAEPTSEYPNFDSVYAAFTRHFRAFREFLAPAGPVSPEGLELSYINLISVADAKEGLIGKVLPDLTWRESADRFLPLPSGFQWLVELPLKGADGAMKVVAQSAIRHLPEGDEPVVRLELTVSGIPNSADDEDLDAWFDAAHEMIVYGFLDLTATEKQQANWRRRG